MSMERNSDPRIRESGFETCGAVYVRANVNVSVCAYVCAHMCVWVRVYVHERVRIGGRVGRPTNIVFCLILLIGTTKYLRFIPLPVPTVYTATTDNPTKWRLAYCLHTTHDLVLNRSALRPCDSARIMPHTKATTSFNGQSGRRT